MMDIQGMYWLTLLSVPTPPKVTGDPFFANVVLLLPFDNTNADFSSFNQTTGSVNIYSDTFVKHGTHSKFGDVSDGTAAYNDSDSFNLSNQSFCMEVWVYMTSYPSTENHYNIMNHAGNGFNMAFNWRVNGVSGTQRFRLSSDGTSYDLDIGSNTAIPLNSWNHIAVVRNGNTVTFYLNGVADGSTSYSNTVNNSSFAFSVGGPSQYFQGYMDDARVTIGVPRYTGNFTPPGPLPLS